MRADPAFSTIPKVEKGQISPTYENILRLADGLKVDVAALYALRHSSIVCGLRSQLPYSARC